MSIESISIISNSKFSLAHNYYNIFPFFNNLIQPLSTKEILERIKCITNQNECGVTNESFDKSTVIVVEISSRIYHDWLNQNIDDNKIIENDNIIEIENEKQENKDILENYLNTKFKKQ